MDICVPGRRGLSVPLQLVLPRYFSCPSTANSLFSLGFQISLNIVFTNNFTVSESFDINIKRLESELKTA